MLKRILSPFIYVTFLIPSSIATVFVFSFLESGLFDIDFPIIATIILSAICIPVFFVVSATITTFENDNRDAPIVNHFRQSIVYYLILCALAISWMISGLPGGTETSAILLLSTTSAIAIFVNAVFHLAAHHSTVRRAVYGICIVSLSLLLVGIAAGIYARTNKVDVLITSYNPGTYIYFNEKALGIAPVCVPNVPPGSHDIRALDEDGERFLGFGFAPSFMKRDLPNHVIADETTRVGIEAVDCSTWIRVPMPYEPTPPTGEFTEIEGDAELFGFLFYVREDERTELMFSLFENIQGTRQEIAQVKVEDGLCTQEQADASTCLSSPHYLRDLNSWVSLPIAGDAEINVYLRDHASLQLHMSANDFLREDVSRDAFLAFYAKQTFAHYEISVQNGEIVALREYYIP